MGVGGEIQKEAHIIIDQGKLRDLQNLLVFLAGTLPVSLRFFCSVCVEIMN